MKDFMMIEGFGGIPSESPFVTPSENRKNTKVVIENWQLGPEAPSIEPGANKEFWKSVAKAWDVEEKVARRRFCANCEYFDNSTYMQTKMERIPLNEWDQDAGGRGFCHKFEFICHNLRVCQAWEECDD
ncbi:MAG: hypothetical protein ACO3UV_08750 [Pseudomonadales bacterium]|jgi:hypothetical protein